MSIEGLKAGGVPLPEPGAAGAGRSRKVEGKPSGAPAEARAAAGGDAVELSEAARGLAGGASTGGTLPPERLREVVDRIESGFYDQPEVLDVVARKVARDL